MKMSIVINGYELALGTCSAITVICLNIFRLLIKPVGERIFCSQFVKELP
jgi:hypothetical protein